MTINKLKKSPFIVAEVSANHNGSINHAKKIIKLAKKSGADAVKLQTYTPDTITVNSKKKDFLIKSGIWKGFSLWQLYEKAQTPFEWQKELFEYSKKIKILCFSTPFDETAVDLLEKIKCPIYKVASFEINHLPLIKKIALTKKPMIISTGTSNLKEIDLAVKTAKNFGAKDITILYCVSNYPSQEKDFNLNNIKILKKRYNCKIGFSDHSKNSKMAHLAAISGAEVFERHLALQNQKKGFDIKFSSKGKDFSNYVKDIKYAFKLLGKDFFYRSNSEKQNIKFKRSIYTIKKIAKNERFTKKNIKIIRPGYGVNPIYYDRILNKKSPISINQFQKIDKKILNKLKIKITI